MITAAAGQKDDGAAVHPREFRIVQRQDGAVHGRVDNAVLRLALHLLVFDLRDAVVHVQIADLDLFRGAHLRDLRGGIAGAVVDPDGFRLGFFIFIGREDRREEAVFQFPVFLAHNVQAPEVDDQALHRILLSGFQGDPEFCFLSEHSGDEIVVEAQAVCPEPAVRRFLPAVAADEMRQVLHRLQRLGVGRRRLGGRRRNVGLQAVDPRKLVLRVFEVQFRLLHADALALELDLGQRGVVAQQRIALFHLVALADEEFRDGLRAAHVDGLQVFRRHSAVVARHIVIVHRVVVRHRRDFHGIGLPAEIPQRADQHSACDDDADGRNQRDFYAFTHRPHRPLRVLRAG